MKNQVSPSVGNALVSGLTKVSNMTLTQNGALTNKSTLSHTLDFFGQGGALRTRTENEINSLFSKAFAENQLAAMKTLFYLRDVRGGQGERRTFRSILQWLAVNHANVIEKNIDNISFFGRWDDLYCLVGTPLEYLIFNVFSTQLAKDMVAMNNGESVSLLAKWLKSENTSSDVSCKLGRLTRQKLNLSSKKYRKILSALRRYIDVVEVKMCNDDWKSIDFSRVTSKAAMSYKNAFNEHNPAGFADFLKKVESGEVKINAGAIYPYEILRSIVKQTNEIGIKSLDLQWKAMPNFLEGNEHKGLVIADTSGSMSGLPLLVSISLAIYFAERNVGPFKDVFLTFSNSPEFHTIVGNNLKEKYDSLDQGGWDQNTNLQLAFDLILSTAVKNKVPAKDMPTVLYIVSDMEFDSACGDNAYTNYETIKNKYENAGYKLPTIVFWNVNSTNNNNPVTVDDKGTVLVSGCSPSILTSILGNKEIEKIDPLMVMLNKLNEERYNKVVV